MARLEQIAQSSFQEFRKATTKTKQVDITLNIILPIANLPIEAGIEGPLTPEMIEEYAQVHEIPLKKAQHYNSIMGERWSSICQLIEHGQQTTQELAEQLELQKEELPQFYEIANYVFENLTTNPNQGKTLYKHVPTRLDQPTKVIIKYTATTKQECQEQIRFLGKDEFSNTPTQNEIGYIMHELNKKINQLGKTQISITIPGIQEKTTEYKPEQLKQKITDYIKKQAV